MVQNLFPTIFCYQFMDIKYTYNQRSKRYKWKSRLQGLYYTRGITVKR